LAESIVTKKNEKDRVEGEREYIPSNKILNTAMLGKIIPHV
jgi:hypothetical protein